MRIYTLKYFDASDWRVNEAEVVAETGVQARELLVRDPEIHVFKRKYDGDAHVAPWTVKMDWVEVVGERAMPAAGVISVRAYYADGHY